MFTLSVVVTSVVGLYARLVVGTDIFRQILSRRQQLSRLAKVGMVQALLLVLYPAYQVTFTHVNRTNYELPVLLILPIVRLALKWIFASAASHKADMIPAQVVFTVDFFDSFYTSTFIQTVSPTTLAVMMTVDVIQTATEMHELHKRTQKILIYLKRESGMETNDSDNYLAEIRLLFSNIRTLKHTVQLNLQVRSCIYHQISDESRVLLNSFENRVLAGSGTISYQHSWKMLSNAVIVVPKAHCSGKCWSQHCFHGKVAANPLPINVIPEATRIKSTSKAHMTKKQLTANTSIILNEALETLFTSECLVLSEWMEIAVPVVYGTFVLAMTFFPSAQYHTELAGISRDNIVDVASRIYLYALMELGSLMILAVVAKKTCRISVLHQLAFVMEAQMPFVQSTLVLWILMTLTYRVVHFGR
ncbi:unnamed protein product [Phytophthora lilii]|uniref:Unnamed protein product n=1 Tax=Phytophthora lilii TaxID=2077276 RepID=A0A9W6TCH7_9STRA|nr:unnamed protein product [Phytophthora lilii]